MPVARWISHPGPENTNPHQAIHRIGQSSRFSPQPTTHYPSYSFTSLLAHAAGATTALLFSSKCGVVAKIRVPWCAQFCLFDKKEASSETLDSVWLQRGHGLQQPILQLSLCIPITEVLLLLPICLAQCGLLRIVTCPPNFEVHFFQFRILQHGVVAVESSG